MNRFIKIALIFFLSSPFYSNAEIISEVVATIKTESTTGKKEVITSRQVRMDWIVETVLYSKSQTSKKEILNSDVKSKEFETELNRFLMETVVYIESKLFKVTESKEDEINSTMTKFKEKLNNHSELLSEWNTLSPTTSEIRSIIERKVQAKNFIEFKAKASLIPPTEAEVFNYYKNNRKKFGTKPYKDFKENIKNYLSKTQADQRLSEWFGVLKKKYQVRKVYY